MKTQMSNTRGNRSAGSRAALALCAGFALLAQVACTSTKSATVGQVSDDGKQVTLQFSRDGRSLMANKANKDALEAKAELQKRKDMSVALMNAVAELSLLGGNPDAAASEARALLKTDLKNVGAMKTLIKVSLAKGRTEEAILMSANALAANPRDADFLSLKGLAHFMADQPLDAREHWKKALVIDPTHVAAQMNLAALYFHNRNISLAGTGFERVLALQPQNLDAQVGKALVLSAQGNSAEAKAMLEAVHAKNPKNSLVLMNLAHIERDRFENYQAALTYTERYLEVAGSDRTGVEKAVASREELRVLVARKAQKMSDEQLRQMAAAKGGQRMQSAESGAPDARPATLAADASAVEKKDAPPSAAAAPDAATKPASKDLGAEDASSLEEAIK